MHPSKKDFVLTPFFCVPLDFFQKVEIEMQVGIPAIDFNGVESEFSNILVSFRMVDDLGCNSDNGSHKHSIPRFKCYQYVCVVVKVLTLIFRKGTWDRCIFYSSDRSCRLPFERDPGGQQGCRPKGEAAGDRGWWS